MVIKGGRKSRKYKKHKSRKHKSRKHKSRRHRTKRKHKKRRGGDLRKKLAHRNLKKKLGNLGVRRRTEQHLFDHASRVATPIAHPPASYAVMPPHTVMPSQNGGFRNFNGHWGGQESAFPPGPVWKGDGNLDAKYYSKLNKPFLPNPKSSKKALGGRKTRKRRGGKRKHGRQRGGGLSNLFANNLAGFSDVRDSWWKMQEGGKNLYNQYFGFHPSTNTSAHVQPIGVNKKPPIMKPLDIAGALNTGSKRSSKFTAV